MEDVCIQQRQHFKESFYPFCQEFATDSDKEGRLMCLAQGLHTLNSANFINCSLLVVLHPPGFMRGCLGFCKLNSGLDCDPRWLLAHRCFHRSVQMLP